MPNRWTSVTAPVCLALPQYENQGVSTPANVAAAGNSVMINLIFKFLKSKERKARRLNRDAVAIIESDCHNHDAKRLNQIAQKIKENLQHAQERSEYDPDADYRNLAYLQTEHKKFRRQPDQAALSAATLTIIYLRAQSLGEPCQPAIRAIDEFLKNRIRDKET